MRASLIRLACLGVAVVLTGCESPAKEAAEYTDVAPALAATNTSFEQAWAKGDAAAVAGLYTADAMLLPPNSPMVRGRDAIQQLWTAFLGSGAGTVKLTSVEALGDEDMAHEVGSYVIHDSTGAVVDQGKYIVIWQHSPDGWRIHRDIWNSDNPPPAVGS